MRSRSGRSASFKHTVLSGTALLTRVWSVSIKAACSTFINTPLSELDLLLPEHQPPKIRDNYFPLVPGGLYQHFPNCYDEQKGESINRLASLLYGADERT